MCYVDINNNNERENWIERFRLTELMHEVQPPQRLNSLDPLHSTTCGQVFNFVVLDYLILTAPRSLLPLLQSLLLKNKKKSSLVASDVEWAMLIGN